MGYSSRANVTLASPSGGWRAGCRKYVTPWAAPGASALLCGRTAARPEPSADPPAGATVPPTVRLVAERFGAEGANVVIASTNAEKLARTVSELGSSAALARIDVTDEAGVDAFFLANGGFDHIANTAGDWDFPPPGPLDSARGACGTRRRTASSRA